MAVGSAAVGLQVLVQLLPHVPLGLIPGQGLREAVTEAAQTSWKNKLDVVVVVGVGSCSWGLIRNQVRNGTWQFLT